MRCNFHSVHTVYMSYVSAEGVVCSSDSRCVVIIDIVVHETTLYTSSVCTILSVIYRPVGQFSTYVMLIDTFSHVATV